MNVEAIEVSLCADGTWQASIFTAGSNCFAVVDGATPREAFDAALAAIGAAEDESGGCTCAEDSDEPWRDHARTCPIYDPAYDRED